MTDHRQKLSSYSSDSSGTLVEKDRSQHTYACTIIYYMYYIRDILYVLCMYYNIYIYIYIYIYIIDI